MLALVVLAASAPRPVRADAVVGTGIGSSCTEAALDAALAGGGNLTFSCGPIPVTIVVASEKTIGVDTSIDGGTLITLDGDGKTRIFTVNSGATLTLANMTISNAVGSAIFIDNGATATVTNSTFSGNNSGAFGGAIYNGGTVTVTNSTFSGPSRAICRTVAGVIPSRRAASAVVNSGASVGTALALCVIRAGSMHPTREAGEECCDVFM